MNFWVDVLQNPDGKIYIGAAKRCEPPLMLALSVREAIRDAIAAFGAPDGEVHLASPSTCEAISNAIASRIGARSAEDKTEHVTAEQVLS